MACSWQFAPVVRTSLLVGRGAVRYICGPYQAKLGAGWGQGGLLPALGTSLFKTFEVEVWRVPLCDGR